MGTSSGFLLCVRLTRPGIMDGGLDEERGSRVSRVVRREGGQPDPEKKAYVRPRTCQNRQRSWLAAAPLAILLPRFEEIPVARTIRCSIVTPDASVFNGDVTYASIPAWDGQLGVLNGQSPTLTRLGIGALRLDFEEGGSRWYLLESGFAQIQDDQLTLLTDAATPAESLSMQEADAELAEANARVTESAEDRAKVERAQQTALAKKAIAGAASGRGGAI